MTVDQALAGVTKLGLDTAPIIYAFEANPDYLDRIIAVFEKLKANQFQAVSSAISLAETLVAPLREANHDLADAYRRFFYSGRNFTLIPINGEVAEQTAFLRAKYRLKTPDALQIAAALVADCDAFLCNDMDLKRVTETRIVVLGELSDARKTCC